MKKKLLLVAGLTLLSSMAMAKGGDVAKLEDNATVDYKFEIIKPLTVKTIGEVDFGKLNPGQSRTISGKSGNHATIKVTGDSRKSLVVTFEDEIRGPEYTFTPRIELNGNTVISSTAINNWDKRGQMNLKVLGQLETDRHIASTEYDGTFNVNFKYQ